MRFLTTATLTCAMVFGAFASGIAMAGDTESDPRADKAASSKEQPSGQEALAVSSAPTLAGRMPIYRPPKVGKPARSVGGGSRGPGDGFPALYVLVPDHVAQSASDQPSLFWYVSDIPKTPARFAFTLLDEEGIEPLVEATLEAPKRAGIHRIKLSDYDVKLEPGTEYEWSVSIVPDPGERAKDIVSTGWIDCVERPSGLDARLTSEGESRSIHVLADEGLWYDALTALGDRMKSNPDDPGLGEMRSDLLRQVGLESVASATL